MRKAGNPTEKHLIDELESLRHRVAELENDMADCRVVEEALKESEERFRAIFDNLRDGLLLVDKETKQFVAGNPAIQRMLDYTEEELNRTGVTDIHPDQDLPWVLDRFEKLARKEIEIARNIPVRKKDGEVFYADISSSFPMVVDGKDCLVGVFRDIAERKHAETFLRIHRDLALALASTSSMTETLDQLLRATLQIEDFDSGGVYLVDGASGEQRLVSHVGLPSGFVDQVSCYGPDTAETRVIMQGEPVYWPKLGEGFGAGAVLAWEELASVAVIPIKSGGRVVAVLNLNSRTQREIPEIAKSELEIIAGMIETIISRVGAEEALKKERENLAEVNSALKVLLQHREQDRRVLEESLLTNVKNLIMPYVEKLAKTQLSSDQELLLEIIESNLREIASPFLRRLSHPLVKLTPMETRVADLIRNGRTTKEIAAVLRTSARSIRFHRENIRGKLELKNNKLNLRSYLCSLA